MGIRYTSTSGSIPQVFPSFPCSGNHPKYPPPNAPAQLRQPSRVAHRRSRWLLWVPFHAQDPSDRSPTPPKAHTPLAHGFVHLIRTSLGFRLLAPLLSSSTPDPETSQVCRSPENRGQPPHYVSLVEISSQTASNRTAVIFQDGHFTASGWLLHVGSSVTSAVGHTGMTKTFDSRQCMRRASQDMVQDFLGDDQRLSLKVLRSTIG
eukprot:g49012.t1